MTTYRLVVGFPGYCVGADGSAWCRLGRGGLRGKVQSKWRKLNPTVDKKTGRLSINLHADGIKVTERMHRLVLEAFIGPCPEGFEGCHLDGNPANNSVTNLYWGTAKDNAEDRAKHGHTVQGEKHVDANFTEDEVRQIRTLHSNGATILDLSRSLGVSLNCIWSIVHRKTWKHVV